MSVLTRSPAEQAKTQQTGAQQNQAYGLRNGRRRPNLEALRELAQRAGSPGSYVFEDVKRRSATKVPGKDRRIRIVAKSRNLAQHRAAWAKECVRPTGRDWRGARSLGDGRTTASNRKIQLLDAAPNLERSESLCELAI